VVVLRRGEIVERGETTRILREPTHEYTRLLVSAAQQDSLRRAGDSDAPAPAPAPVQEGHA
jgi:peptide/nickel transport system ATP-binding protein